MLGISFTSLWGSWVPEGAFWTITQIETREHTAGSRQAVHRRSPSFLRPLVGCSVPPTD